MTAERGDARRSVMTRDELWQWALDQAAAAPRLSEEQREVLRPLLAPQPGTERAA